MKAAVVTVSILLSAVLACGDIFGSPDFRYSEWIMGCGPTDGPATWIAITRDPLPAGDATYPLVSISIERSVSEVQGAWAVGSGATSASASYYPRTGEGQPAMSGRVTITAVDPDSTIHGSFDLRFPQRITGALHATWSHRSSLCG